jgi:hypothetical protein
MKWACQWVVLSAKRVRPTHHTTLHNFTKKIIFSSNLRPVSPHGPSFRLTFCTYFLIWSIQVTCPASIILIDFINSTNELWSRVLIKMLLIMHLFPFLLRSSSKYFHRHLVLRHPHPRSSGRMRNLKLYAYRKKEEKIKFCEINSSKYSLCLIFSLFFHKYNFSLLMSPNSPVWALPKFWKINCLYIVILTCIMNILYLGYLWFYLFPSLLTGRAQ